MLSEKPLTYSERREFTHLLNEGGYVLDFNNYEFSEFTKEVTGVDILARYRLSKGKSLEAYLAEAPRRESLALLQALMAEWQRSRQKDASEYTAQLAEACFARLQDLTSAPCDGGTGDRLKAQGFTSEYPDEQRSLLWEKVESHPTASIGIAKDLVESCCVTILDSNQVQHSSNDDIPKLVDKTQNILSINPRKVEANVPDSIAVKSLLGNLAQVAKNLAELRNSYGIGHGKPATYKPLTERHARLAAGSALTLVEYLWTTHLERSEKVVT